MQAHDDPRADENLAGDAIDLGEARWDQDRETAHVPWHPPAWLRHGPKALAVVLLTLLALHVPGELTTGLGAPLWTASVQWDGLTLGSDVVYVPEGSNGTSIVARDAWTGQEVWRRGLDARVLHAIDLGNGIAAILTRRMALDGTPTDTVSTILRARTGEVLLDRDGSRPPLNALGTTDPAGDLLLLEDRAAGADGCPMHALDGGCRVLRVVSIPGAEPVWSLVTPTRAALLASFEDGMVGELATVEAGGRVDLHDIRTGAVTATMTVEANVTGGVLTADHLVLTTQDTGQALLTGYDRRSLSRAWQTRVPLGLWSPWIYVYECEDLVCTDTAGGTSLIDPGSGRVVLVVADRVIVNLGNGLVLSTGGPASSAANQTVTLWNATATTVVAELPNASIVNWTGSGGRGLLARHGSQGTGFILVEPSGATRMLATVAEQVTGCQAQGRLLVCLSLGRLIAWRLPV